MNSYQVKIDEEELPNSFTFDELIENGLLDERDEHIKIKLIEETEWIIARDYPFSISEKSSSDNYRLNEDGSVTRNVSSMTNYSLNLIFLYKFLESCKLNHLAFIILFMLSSFINSF